MQFNQNSKAKCAGTALAYTKEVISLGLLYFNFRDAICENDGPRIFNVYRHCPYSKHQIAIIIVSKY